MSATLDERSDTQRRGASAQTPTRTAGTISPRGGQKPPSGSRRKADPDPSGRSRKDQIVRAIVTVLAIASLLPGLAVLVVTVADTLIGDSKPNPTAGPGALTSAALGPATQASSTTATTAVTPSAPVAPAAPTTVAAPVAPAPKVTAAAPATPAAKPGAILMVAADGGVFGLGGAEFLGSAQVPSPVVSVGTASIGGYWLAHSDGTVERFGKGGLSGTPKPITHSPVVSIAVTPTGRGYLLATVDGSVFAYGDANFIGSLAGQPLAAPITQIVSTPSGKGYWLVASDGGVFAYGDAAFAGSTPGSLAAPIVSLATTPSGKGYWLTAADGGVFAFGDATFAGSLAGTQLISPIVVIVPTASGKGYTLVAADGGVFAYGDAAFGGSLGGAHLNAPVVGAVRG